MSDVLDQLVEFIALTVEELSAQEVDALDIGNTLVDPDLNVVTIDVVRRDEEDGEVESADVVRYETPVDPEGDAVLYRRGVGSKELEKYEVA